MMFKRSVETLLNLRNGLLVIDDEFISSRARDVETKVLSNRKTGKKGPVSDCVACSFTSIMYGLRLRVKGETQEDNVQNLIQSLSTKYVQQR